MSDDQRPERAADRWRALPPRTPVEDLVAGHEVPPKPQAVAEPGITPLDEATRYPI
ncbi:hypothetical protein [Spirillospora sp. NPDC029432]|uniref:hypothetical protein n=1 Tax=Spirillospora sp. NPDC029432 TaxID=3154599 RepID=UPI003452FC3B